MARDETERRRFVRGTKKASIDHLAQGKQIAWIDDIYKHSAAARSNDRTNENVAARETCVHTDVGSDIGTGEMNIMKRILSKGEREGRSLNW